MGSYIYRLSKRSDAITAMRNGKQVTVGVYEYAYKPYLCWDGEAQNRKWENQARLAVLASWKHGDRPELCVLGYRDEHTKQLEVYPGCSVMRYLDDITWDDGYEGSPAYTIGYLNHRDGQWVIEPVSQRIPNVIDKTPAVIVGC